MKKYIYFSAVACCMLMLSGCSMPQKQVVTPAPIRSYEQPGQYSGANDQQPQAGPKSVRQPRYLDIADSEQFTPDEVGTDVVVPSMNYINDRSFEYGRKLDRWKELDNQALALNLSQEDTEQMVRCFRKLQKVLKGYNNLREDILQSGKLSAEGQVRGGIIQDLQKEDIAFLESPCGRLLSGTEDKSAGWGQREEKADLSQLETLIDRYAANEEYEEVVQVWLQIPEFQIERVDLRTRILYGNALMYLHQEEEAAEVYQQIVDRMSASEEQSTDLISLRKVLADLYTAAGNYPVAETQYKKISQDYQMLGSIEEWSKLQLSILERSLQGSPELTEYSGLLRNYLGFIPEQDGYKLVWQAEKFLLNYPYSAVSSNVDIIKARAQERADKWLDAFVVTVDQLAGEKKYQEAMELLETIPVDILGEEKQNEFKVKNDEFIIGEAVERETEKLAKVQELQRQWNSGMLMVKAERYDEAIALFTEMLETEYGVKAESKIEEVSMLAAKADRRKAADLFIRFTKTTDLDSKKKLLIESRKLLKDILVKYPEVDIAEKVIGNIQRVEQEMNTLDPNLLLMADMETVTEEEAATDAFDIPPVVAPESQEPIVEQDIQ